MSAADGVIGLQTFVDLVLHNFSSFVQSITARISVNMDHMVLCYHVWNSTRITVVAIAVLSIEPHVC